MTTKKPGRKFEVELDWYYVSKESVGKWALVFGLLGGLVFGGVYLYTHQPSRAKRDIAAAEEMFAQARASPEGARSKDEIDTAAKRIAVAKAFLESGHDPEASTAALDAQRILQRILNRGSKNPNYEAAIVEVGGKVEVQRASRATWEAARLGMKLYDGDFVKTGANGAIEVVSVDGTLFRIKQETLFEVHRTSTVAGAAPGEPSRVSEMQLITGVMDTNTGEGARTKVRTDGATTDINARSVVGVNVDDTKATGVSAFSGNATVQTQDGKRITLGQRERVVASLEGGLSAKMKLPDPPKPLVPDDDAIFDLRKTPRLTLRWSPSKEALRYKLQIARSRLFIPDSLIAEEAGLEKSEAGVGLNEQGLFFWRVATIGKANLTSEWAMTRRFKVVSGDLRPSGSRKLPPELFVQRPQVISNIVTVSGKTEPGASVTVNGERADTDPSGAFKKIISINKEGFNTITIRAVNGEGLDTVRSETVNIQIF